MDTFYKELIKMKDDSDNNGKEISEQRNKMNTDLLQFYKKYDLQSGDLGA